MDMARHYRMAILAVDPGACNLSGLANDLPRMLDDIQEELGEIDPELINEIDQLLFAISDAWKVKRSTRYVNTHPYIKASVQRLAGWAFETQYMRRVPSHPVMRLMIDQMRQLAEVPTPDEPLYTERWGEAYDMCKEKGQADESS